MAQLIPILGFVAMQQLTVHSHFLAVHLIRSTPLEIQYADH
jgi:hypothetical protein